MPIDVETEILENPSPLVEVSAADKHIAAKAMINELMAKGMAPGEIQAYALGHLDGGGDEFDPGVLNEVLHQVNTDTMSQQVVDNEISVMEQQFSTETGSNLEQSAKRVNIQVTSQDDSLDEDYDPIAARTNNPSGKEVVAPENDVIIDDPIENAKYQVNKINIRLLEVNKIIDEQSVDDNQLQELEKEKNNLLEQLKHFNIRLQKEQQEQDQNSQTDEQEETPLARTNNPSGLEGDDTETTIHIEQQDAGAEGVNEPQEITDPPANNEPASPDEPPENAEPPIEGEESNPSEDLDFGSYDRASLERDARNLRHQYAENKIADDLESGSFVRKTLKRIFKGKILRQHYSTRYKLEYDRLVKEAHGEIYAPIVTLYGEQGISPEDAIRASRAAMSATLERVMDNEFLDAEGNSELLRDGESRQEISGNEIVDNQLRSAVKDLTLRYARGELDETTILEERDRLFGEIDGINPELFGKGVRFADNILELANNVRAALEHGAAMDRVEEALARIELSGAIARSGANTELKTTVFDKISDKLQTSRIGGTAIASSILLAGSVVMSATTWGSQRAASTALRMTGIGAGAAGVIAAANEYSALRREAAYHRQESAYGVEHERGVNPRRDAMEALVHEMQDTTQATETLRSYIDDTGGLRQGLSGQEIVAALTEVERIKAIMTHADEGGVDLLRFSSPEAAPRERLQLMRTRLELERALEQQQGDLTLIGPDGNEHQQPVKEVFSGVRKNIASQVESDIRAEKTKVQDAYEALMAKRIVKAFVVGSVAGFTIGAITQEAIAMVNPNVAGVFEYQESGKTNTLLNSVIFGEHNGGYSNPQVAEALQGSTGTEVITYKGTALNLEVPDGFEAKFDGTNNTFDLVTVKGGTVVADNIEFSKNGEISQQAIDELQKVGLKINQSPVSVDGAPKSVGADKFIDTYEKQGSIETAKVVDNAVNRDPGLTGDHNELDLHAGGKDGNWKLDSGSVRIEVAGLEQSGSWNGNNNWNVPQALEEGRGKIMLTVNDEFKSSGKYKTFLFDVERGKNGEWRAIIPNEHPASKWFGDGGSISDYHGPSLEQLQNPNVDYLDSHNSLAFVIEEGTTSKGVHEMVSVASIAGTGEVPYEVPTPEIVYTAIMTGEPLPTGNTLPVVGPPLYPRRGIGAPITRRRSPNPYYQSPNGYSYDNYAESEQATSAELERIRSEASPRMLAGEDLDLAREAEWYRSEIAQRQGQEYADEIDQLLKDTPDLHKLPAQTKALVVIPVGATGESENIYNTLSLYAGQEGIVTGEFTIILGVNNIEGQKDDPNLAAKINKTIAEIERAKADFPEISIIVANFEISKELLQRRQTQAEGPGIIGDITRRMYDIATLAAAEHVQKPDSQEKDILLIRSDADISGMSPVYIERTIKGLQTMPNADAYRGEKQYGITDPEVQQNLPGLALTKAFGMFILASKVRRKPKEIYLDGCVLSIKASSYAGMGGMGTDQYSGAGSDDVKIGNRLRAVRKNSIPTGDGQYYGSSYDTLDSRKDDDDGPLSSEPIRFVGAYLDSDPTRQIGPYLQGINPNSGRPWANYNDSETGVRSRSADLPDVIVKETLETSLSRAARFIGENLQGYSRAEAEVLLARFFGGSDRVHIITDNNNTVIRIEFTDEGKKFIGGVIKRDASVMRTGRGAWISRNRRLLRSGKAPQIRWVTA